MLLNMAEAERLVWIFTAIAVCMISDSHCVYLVLIPLRAGKNNYTFNVVTLLLVRKLYVRKLVGSAHGKLSRIATGFLRGLVIQDYNIL